MARSKNKEHPTSKLRIIGGQWRSRKLPFIPTDGLRPTPDRVRETLFNWLAPVIVGARCADLFAGSGALGLEALSRGALHCDFIDTAGSSLSQISTHLSTLKAATNSHSCHRGTADHFLTHAQGPLDIIFIDPPFNQGLIEPTCKALASSQMLAKEAWIYIETPSNHATPTMPTNWISHRAKVAGEVSYQLFRVVPPSHIV